MTLFDGKSQGMQEFLNSAFGIGPAQSAGACASCGSPAGSFRDETSAREYEISGLCQACQDAAFAPEDGTEGLSGGHEHVDYPHYPGRMWECLGCSSGPCRCTDGEGCVSNSCPYNDFD